MKSIVAVMLIAIGACCSTLRAQTPPQGSSAPRGVEIAGTFTMVRANAAPGDCGCFFMYGGGAQAAVVNRVGVAFLFDYGRTSATNINDAGHNLVLSTYMGGVRYSLHREGKLSPYGQVLVGAGHTSSNYAIDADVWRLAASVGGGLNVRLSRRVEFRPVEAQYLLTRIPNSVNEIQNQLRLSSGLVFFISRR